jgi:hypothetical protein
MVVQVKKPEGNRGTPLPLVYESNGVALTTGSRSMSYKELYGKSSRIKS